jgi:ankyrin repeat protein
MTPEKQLLEFIRKGDNAQLEKLLAHHHTLANGKTEQGVSFLLMAAYHRNSGAVDLIRSKKDSIDLYEAAAIGDLPIVKESVEQGKAALNSFSPDGFTPLGLACFFNHLDVAGYLIEKGADVNIHSNNAFNVAPVHSACSISSYELTALLLQHGAKANVRQAGDVTPLHQAAHNGQTKIALLLLENGANANAKTTKGESPLQMALEKSHYETAQLIKEHGGT